MLILVCSYILGICMSKNLLSDKSVHHEVSFISLHAQHYTCSSITGYTRARTSRGFSFALTIICSAPICADCFLLYYLFDICEQDLLIHQAVYLHNTYMFRTVLCYHLCSHIFQIYMSKNFLTIMKFLILV